MEEIPLLDQLVEAVRAGARYGAITPSLVRRIAAAELAKGRSFKDAIKATRNKLHQVGGAYQETRIDYLTFTRTLETLSAGDPPQLKEFCLKVMAQHTSTRERLPVLERFYTECLAPLRPVQSVMDLACGLNPLALPWMPLAEGSLYYGCDIYADMIDFLNLFLKRLGRDGGIEACDLTAGIPDHPVQLALLLKAIPCLEQIDKDAVLHLLEQIPADHILVSFPAHSLGGHGKGMPATYEAHFHQLLQGKPWKFRKFVFPGELAFLISR
jgi:16S rRNA (guanine(1405)-N(7))-methyltransferase